MIHDSSSALNLCRAHPIGPSAEVKDHAPASAGHGPAQLGRWKWHDPDAHIQLLVEKNTRLWILSPAKTDRQRPRRNAWLRRPISRSNRNC